MNTDSYVTQHGVIVIPRVADIVKSVADAVVTSEDTGLKYESMVSQALCRLDEGGEYFRQHCSDLYEKHPKYKFGDVFHTSMNKYRRFPFKYILHAVLGPYDEESHTGWMESLSHLYTNVFAQADELLIKSIALPFLATGIYGGNRHAAVRVAIHAIGEYKPQNLQIVQFFCLGNELIKYATYYCEKYLTSTDSVTDEKKQLSTHNSEHGSGDDRRKNEMHDAGNLKMKSVQRNDSDEHEDTASRERHLIETESPLESQGHEIESGRDRNDKMDHTSEDDDSTTGKSHRDEVKSIKSEKSEVGSTASDSVRASDDQSDESDIETPKSDSQVSDQPHQHSESDEQCKDSNVNKELVGQREEMVDQHKESVDQNQEQDNQSKESDDQNESSPDSGEETEIQSRVHNDQIEGDHMISGKEAEDQEDDSDNQIQDTGDQQEHQGSLELSSESKTLDDKESLPQAEEEVCPILDDKKNLHQVKDSTKTTAKEEEEVCPICMDAITDVKELDKCGHKFCRECIDDNFKYFKPVCPTCQKVYGVLTGNMPKGTMSVRSDLFPSLSGYEGYGVIIIDYSFPDGRQTKEHPHPGRRYYGTSRTAYLPNNKEGQTVLDLLMLAFDRNLTFTVGRSVTTGQDDMVIWNDIHHKTSTTGGSAGYGYPDETYLSRVKEELASKGVTEDQLPGNRGQHTK